MRGWGCHETKAAASFCDTGAVAGRAQSSTAQIVPARRRWRRRGSNGGVWGRQLGGRRFTGGDVARSFRVESSGKHRGQVSWVAAPNAAASVGFGRLRRRSVHVSGAKGAVSREPLRGRLQRWQVRGQWRRGKFSELLNDSSRARRRRPVPKARQADDPEFIGNQTSHHRSPRKNGVSERVSA